MSRQTRAQTRAQSRACMPLFTLDGVRDDPEISIAPLYRSPTADVTPQGPELIRSTTPLTPGGDNRGDTPPVRRDCDDREGRNNTDDAGGPNLRGGYTDRHLDTPGTSRGEAGSAIMTDRWRRGTTR